MKCIVAVLVVLGMFMTAGATPHAPSARAPIYEPQRVSRAELREDLHRRKMFQTIFRMSEGSFVKFAHLLSPALQKKNERYKKLYTWYLVPGIRVPGTALYVFCISRRHLLRPATPTGTFSALGWDHFPSTLAYSLRTKHNLRCVY